MDASSDEEPTVIRRAGDKLSEEVEKSDEEKAKKAQMDADIAERDAFVARMLDKESTKNQDKQSRKD